MTYDEAKARIERMVQDNIDRNTTLLGIATANLDGCEKNHKTALAAAEITRDKVVEARAIIHALMPEVEKELEQIRGGLGK